MKKITIILSLILFANCGVQKKITENDLIEQIILGQVNDNGKTKIVRELNAELAEEFFQRFSSQNNLLFENDSRQVQLTNEEVETLYDSIKEQFGFNWNNEELKGYEFIESEEDITEFLLQDKNNRVLMLSKPILFRNNELLFEYIAHFGFGQAPDYIGYRLYYNDNGTWKNFINLNN